MRLGEQRGGGVGGVGLGVRLEEREVDDEDVCLPRLEAGHVEEVDVVLREGHHRRVVRRVEARLAHIRPRQRRAGRRVRGGGDGGEVEEEELEGPLKDKAFETEDVEGGGVVDEPNGVTSLGRTGAWVTMA